MRLTRSLIVYGVRVWGEGYATAELTVDDGVDDVGKFVSTGQE